MLNNWNQLLNTDCVVIQVQDNFIYPIFRNGTTSLETVTDKEIINRDISACQDIIVYVREPKQRFIKGLNEYCYQNNLDVKETWQKVHRGELVDRHFVPQFIWLLHLYKYYKGNVVLKDVGDIKQICTAHLNRTKKFTEVEVLDDFVRVDRELDKYVNKSTLLNQIIEECRHVLS